jgi:hypothetical protein
MYDSDMSILTPELRRAVDAAGEQPVAVIDPETHERYVLLRAEVYERLHVLFDQGPFSQREQRFALQEAGKRAGWNDPEMDIYNDLDSRP